MKHIKLNKNLEQSVVGRPEEEQQLLQGAEGSSFPFSPQRGNSPLAPALEEGSLPPTSGA